MSSRRGVLVADNLDRARVVAGPARVVFPGSWGEGIRAGAADTLFGRPKVASRHTDICGGQADAAEPIGGQRACLSIPRGRAAEINIGTRYSPSELRLKGASASFRDLCVVVTTSGASRLASISLQIATPRTRHAQTGSGAQNGLRGADGELEAWPAYRQALVTLGGAAGLSPWLQRC
jgi:hypothetical protein